MNLVVTNLRLGLRRQGKAAWNTRIIHLNQKENEAVPTPILQLTPDLASTQKTKKLLISVSIEVLIFTYLFRLRPYPMMLRGYFWLRAHSW